MSSGTRYTKMKNFLTSHAYLIANAREPTARWRAFGAPTRLPALSNPLPIATRGGSPTAGLRLFTSTESTVGSEELAAGAAWQPGDHRVVAASGPYEVDVARRADHDDVRGVRQIAVAHVIQLVAPKVKRSGHVWSSGAPPGRPCSSTNYQKKKTQKKTLNNVRRWVRRARAKLLPLSHQGPVAGRHCRALHRHTIAERTATARPARERRPTSDDLR